MLARKRSFIHDKSQRIRLECDPATPGGPDLVPEDTGSRLAPQSWKTIPCHNRDYAC